MAKQPTPPSIDAYIAGFPAETQLILEDVRALIRATAPDATERISYEIPTFDMNGTYLIYFAGWKKYISMYPVSGRMVDAFGDELRPYRSGKGTVRFPLSKPLPKDLIRRIVEYRIREVKSSRA